ncbi:hypothetical protein MHUMG1_08506 [Metarhizium humberi]|uniref:Aminotransferase class V domain-containing protein n=1 Tax=Metarhizium humberi TaxID=2596975 RepID=A0A9P8M809_9HYPO|nr:hypothetical protein MHUMG1_08506 [Metarhizium humberi]
MAWSNEPNDGQHDSSTNAPPHPNGSSKLESAQCAIYAVTAGESVSDVIDMDRVRPHFPVLSGKTVPFNNAAGTVVLKEAIEAASDLMNGMPIDHGLGDPRSTAARAEYSNNWRQCAAFVNAQPSEIASASAWIHLARSLGITIKWWTPSQDGQDDPCLTVDSLRPLLTPKTRIVTCNHVSNVVGTIHPIRELARLVHTIPGCVIAVDGVAWIPHRPVDVKLLDVDFYCFSWYKVFGPHMAQLYAHRRAQDRYMTSINHFWRDHATLDGKIHLGAACFELEAMCGPIAKYLGDLGWDAIIQHETVLTKVMLDYLLSRPTVYRVFGKHTADPSHRVSIVVFEVLGRQSSDIVMQVHVRDRFRITWGDCWAPRPTFDVLRPHSDGIIRVSFVHYNTVAEVQGLCAELEDITST